MWTRVLCALAVVYIAATALHVGLAIGHEPFAYDAWNVAVDTRGEPISAGRFLDYWWYQYTHSNPRLGQALTYLSYKVSGFAELATPIAYLALTLAITVLGIARWPWRRARDLGLWVIAIGFGWFVFPEIGRNMFCRGYSANYIYGAAIQLWFLVPLRLARGYQASPRACVGYAAAGVIAGLCNEHTGPTLLALFAILAWRLRRAGERPRLVWAGGLGFALGFAAIFFAPGQAERYDGLAGRVGLAMRLLQRSVIGNLDIVRDYLTFAAPLLCLLVALLVIAQLREPDRAGDARAAERAQRMAALRLVAIALVAGLALAATLFVSPKLGSRFFLVSLALLLAAVIAVIDAVLPRGGQRAVLIALAVAASIYAAVRTLPLYLRVAREGEARIAGLAATPPGGVYLADAFPQTEESWWYIGDDFRFANKRELVARYLGLARVGFRGWDPEAPLGVTGIRLLPQTWIAGERCVGRHDAYDVAGIKPFDLAGLQSSARTSAELLSRSVALERFEVSVELTGAQPLPRPHLVLARWRAGRFEAYQGTIARRGVLTRRDVTLSRELRERPFEVFVVQIGSDYRRLGTTRDELSYTPWRSGVYWVLACDAGECWIVAAGRNQTV